MSQSDHRRKTVLVTGANGFLGAAIAKAFSLAGWHTYGLVRKPDAAAALLRNEVLPIIGSAANSQEWISAASDLNGRPIMPNGYFDVVVCTTEDQNDWQGHFDDNVEMFTSLARQRQSVLGMLSGTSADVNADSNANKEEQQQEKLLVLYTSGCKDYGMTAFHGDANLSAHTEESPLNPPPLISARTQNSVKIVSSDYADDFDAISLRPTTLYGHSATYYGILFDLAAKTAATTTTTTTKRDPNPASNPETKNLPVLTLKANPNSILHGTHVDDASQAYVILASLPPQSRPQIARQIYNISGAKYETLSSVTSAMERSYGIQIDFVDPPAFSSSSFPGNYLDVTVMFPQWVSSAKIRRETGWTDRRLGFVEGFEVYRRTFERLAEDGDEGVRRIRDLGAVTF